MSALTIRLPESIHDHVRKLASQEGLSMNQFVMRAVAEKVIRLDEARPGRMLRRCKPSAKRRTGRNA